jgi:hypothetical protein
MFHKFSSQRSTTRGTPSRSWGSRNGVWEIAERSIAAAAKSIVGDH